MPFNDPNTTDPDFNKDRGKQFMIEIGDVFAERYEVVAQIGAGAMGTVYKVFDSRLARIAALKIPRIPPHHENPEEFLYRFEREAKAAAGFHHPSLCPVYDVGEHHGVHYLTMAFIEGETLESRLEKGPLPVREALEHIRVVALALVAPHEKGIVHRDLKPANIIITNEDNRAVLMDFGLARFNKTYESDDSFKTKPNVILGTPAYMSPEQIKAESDQFGPATDVYSLGIVLFELLTGRRPFDEASVYALMFSILNKEPVKPSQYQPGLDRRLDTICLKAIARSPQDRYQNMKEFANALQTVLNLPSRAAGPRQTSPSPSYSQSSRGPRKPSVPTNPPKSGARRTPGRPVPSNPSSPPAQPNNQQRPKQQPSRRRPPQFFESYSQVSQRQVASTVEGPPDPGPNPRKNPAPKPKQSTKTKPVLPPPLPPRPTPSQLATPSQPEEQPRWRLVHFLILGTIFLLFGLAVAAGLILDFRSRN